MGMGQKVVNTLFIEHMLSLQLQLAGERHESLARGTSLENQ